MKDWVKDNKNRLIGGGILIVTIGVVYMLAGAIAAGTLSLFALTLFCLHYAGVDNVIEWIGKALSIATTHGIPILGGIVIGITLGGSVAVLLFELLLMEAWLALLYGSLIAFGSGYAFYRFGRWLFKIINK